MPPSPQHIPPLFHRKPNDQRQSLSLNLEGRCDLAPWRCCISVCSIQKLFEVSRQPSRQGPLWLLCRVQASHSSMASASRHRWGSPVFGSDLGFVLSRYRTTQNPLFEGRFRPLTLDSVLWLTNQQHHHRMLMAILLNWPLFPLSSKSAPSSRPRNPIG